MDAEFSLHLILGAPDQVDDIRTCGTALIDDEIGVHIRDAGMADFAAFQTGLFNKAGGVILWRVLED